MHATLVVGTIAAMHTAIGMLVGLLGVVSVYTTSAIVTDLKDVFGSLINGWVDVFKGVIPAVVIVIVLMLGWRFGLGLFKGAVGARGGRRK
jgi:hypothetical protein